LNQRDSLLQHVKLDSTYQKNTAVNLKNSAILKKLSELSSEQANLGGAQSYLSPQ